MVKIQIKQDFINAHPEFATNFFCNLGNEEGGAYGVLASGEKLGGYNMRVQVDNPLLIENEIFQVLVNNSISGSFPRFLNNLLQYVSNNVLEVFQDNGAVALTKKQIIDYQAP